MFILEFKNGDYVINEYCSELKRQVQLAKELKIQAIELNDIKLVEMKTENFNEKSDQIFMLIEKFQNDSLKSYELFDKSKFIEKLRMSITIQKSKFASKLTTIKSMLEKWNNIANDPTSNDQTLLKETHSAQDAQSRLAVSIDEFKSICFRGKIAEFYQHDGKNSFGTLKFSWFNQINIKNFEYIDLMPHIKNIRGHADLNKEKDFLFLHDQYEFLCVCLENLHTVVFVRDRKGVNRNTLILFLFDEKKQIKDTKLMHLGEYAYFGFIRACGNKVVFSYGHDDEIKSFLCVLGEHLNLLHKIEHENNQLLVGANESFIYTSSNSEQAKASLNLKQSPIFVYDWLAFYFYS
jgi:DNA-binding transcriptional regulator YiaG